MSRTYLNISLSVESDAPLDQLIEEVKERIEGEMVGLDCVVWSATWDREMALQQARAEKPVQRVLSTREEQAELLLPITKVCEEFNVTLPKAKPGMPWRVLGDRPHGVIEGLPGMRGMLVLTDGVHAIMIRGSRWATVHIKSFLPDDVELWGKIATELGTSAVIKESKPKKPTKLQQSLSRYE